MPITTTVLSPAQNVSIRYVGSEKLPLVIIDDFHPEPEVLVSYAKQRESQFCQVKQDLYPGIRLPVPDTYLNYVAAFLSQHVVSSLSSAPSRVSLQNGQFSIANCSPDTLLPIQRIPHVDTLKENQWAGVHYLCTEHHGGTGFFRHRQTGYESLNQQRSKRYMRVLDDQATRVGVPEAAYLQGSDDLFELIELVDVAFNRAIFYPANCLHSGVINRWQAQTFDQHRLTANVLLSL